jgi:hypothetical protein
MVPPQPTGQLTAQRLVLMAEHQQFDVLGQIRPGQHHQQANKAPQQAVNERQQRPEMVPATLPIPQQSPAHSTKPSFRAGHPARVRATLALEGRPFLYSDG